MCGYKVTLSMTLTKAALGLLNCGFSTCKMRVITGTVRNKVE